MSISDQYREYAGLDDKAPDPKLGLENAKGKSGGKPIDVEDREHEPTPEATMVTETKPAQKKAAAQEKRTAKKTATTAAKKSAKK